MKKALFLDRDGVINVERSYTFRIEDFVLLEGIIPLCRAAQHKGYRLIVVTNQSGIARGLYTHQDVEVVHTYMWAQLQQQGIELDAVYYCPHHPDFTGACLCRKPDSLMLEKGRARFGIDPGLSFLIGDSERDIQAGKSLGCQTIRIHPEATTADYRIDHLTEVIKLL